MLFHHSFQKYINRKTVFNIDNNETKLNIISILYSISEVSCGTEDWSKSALLL